MMERYRTPDNHWEQDLSPPMIEDSKGEWVRFKEANKEINKLKLAYAESQKKYYELVTSLLSREKGLR